MNKSEREYYEKIARKTAKEICSYGDCYAPYKCRHANHKQPPFRKLGTSDVCPLSKYKFHPAQRKSFFDVPRLEMEDFTCICICCDKPKIIEADGYVEVDSSECFMECCDCPVQSAIECYQERMAESET